MPSEGDEVKQLSLAKIAKGKSLLTKIEELEKARVNGASKFKKRVLSEIKFLTKALESDSDLKEEHVQCSNLGQLGAVLTVAAGIPDVTGLLQPFTMFDQEKIVVDIVGQSGKQWIKVIMRNPKALHVLYVCGGRNGTKPLDEVADDFLICAEKHPVFYKAPEVVFWFCCGVSESLAKALDDRGIQVQGQRIPDHTLGLPDFSVEESDSETQGSGDEESESSYDDSDTNNSEVSQDSDECSEDGRNQVNRNKRMGKHKAQDESMFSVSVECCDKERNAPGLGYSHERLVRCDAHTEDCTSPVPGKSDNMDVCQESVKKINLDITAMIAYVSSTANGRANFIFKDKLLSQQAQWERENPVKETLNRYFEGCELMACQEAVDHFLKIVNVCGGEGERTRAKDLVDRLTIIPSVNCLKDQVKCGGRVSERALLVFGTGLAHRAITVTSNGSFIRSAEQKGVRLAVLFHQPRALTEAKESTAEPL